MGPGPGSGASKSDGIHLDAQATPRRAGHAGEEVAQRGVGLGPHEEPVLAQRRDTEAATSAVAVAASRAKSAA